MGAAIGLTVGLALFGFYGIGQLYVGRVARGLLILFGDWVISILGIVFLIAGFAFPGFLVLALICFLFSFGWFIWQAVDVANLAGEWNASVEDTGEAPW